jgi:hypothetical protein
MQIHTIALPWCASEQVATPTKDSSNVTFGIFAGQTELLYWVLLHTWLRNAAI